MTAKNSLADEVRQYCMEHYVEPARNNKKAIIEICTGDVHTALGYKNRLPLVCSSLGARTFETMCEISRLSIDGPLNGSTTIFRFLLTGKRDFNSRIDGYAKILDCTTNRTVVQLPNRTFPSVVLQGDELMGLRHDLFKASILAKDLKDTALENALIGAFDVIDDCYKRVCKVTNDPSIS